MASVLFVAMAAVPASAGNEGTLLSRINASRAAAGKPPVEVYWDLTDDARAHTSAMIANGSIYH
ncbi:MAG: CAP domain-containing protein, partial [Acidimicrobiia bacterium]